MKKIYLILFLFTLTLSGTAQTTLTLDSCRAMALRNNKSLLASRARIQKSQYDRKAAHTAYLPKVALTAGYMRTGDEISLLSDDQKSRLSSLGTNAAGALQQAAGQIVQQMPDLAPLVQSLGTGLAPVLDQAGQQLVDALRTDTRNLFVGNVSLTQPLYMGGKIRAYNRIAHYAEAVAGQQLRADEQEVVLSVDQAYWQVVSLTEKKKLAEQNLSLLTRIDSDMQKMVAEGVATKANALTVSVKLNEAEMLLTRVDNGLSLASMLLCQLCGLDLSSPITLKDETEADLLPAAVPTKAIDLNAVYANRPEIRSLELATNIYHQKVNVVRADYLPSIALLGGYMATSPSVFNSFEKKFKGMWNLGITVSLPIWHWGEGIYKVKAAKSEARIAQYQLQDAREKIELQVNQSAFQVNEAAKKLVMAEKNLEKANENLRYATLGFEEGVIPASNVLEAHTAWLSAQSEKIDAQIDVKLTEIYLKKAMGELTINH